MFKGFYNLTSGMLTQGKNLNVIANNMTNIATSGFKTDRFTAQTFDEVMWSRVGNKNKQYEDLGNQSYITVPSQLYTDYTQGSFDETGMPLDFAIEGDGFFAVETAEGRAYTRNGSFTLDDEGYLFLPGQGRVLDDQGEPILLITDKIVADDRGGLYMENGGLLGRIGVYAFEDNEQLTKDDRGMFASQQEPQAAAVRVYHKMTERSNVDLVQQMTAMIAGQRAYQSAAQVTKIYDQVISKAANDAGRL